MADPVISFVIERAGDLLIQKDAAYDAEDVIEVFASKVEFIKNKGFVNKLADYPLKIVNLYKIGKEVKSLQIRLNDIVDSREKYGIKNIGEGTSTHGEELQRLRRSSPINEDKDIVGFEKITKSLVAELLKEDENRRVVSIIGMGGVGKTTLAKKVYNHADVRARFNCRAWVCVSSIYSHKETLKTIIKQLNPITNELLEMLKNMEEQDLEQRLYEDLQDKCYLVVLDDVWKEAAWACLARAFPDVSKSSKILLTSRNRDVALHADALRIPYELKTLGHEDGWQLFLRKALGYKANAGCPPDLEEVGREIARRCAGLPLAITVTGGLLSVKKLLKSEWEKVLNNFSTYLSRNESGLSEILELSYADLPPNLKFCFLYLGLFPEDSVISVRKLIHMWIAEGVMQKRDAENLEEAAAYDVEQLLSRNMFQVAEMTVDERIKSCRVHDLLRELAIKKAKDERFFHIHDITKDEVSAKSRYLAVHTLSQDKKYFRSSTPHLRSLLFFDVNNFMQEDSLSFKSFRKLRVLDLENVRIESLPKNIGEVRLLRYLGLRGTWIKKLPHSLGCLRNLQTLDLFNFDWVVEVSNIIWRLESLRHLYAYGISCDVPLKIEGLRNLQTLLGMPLNDIMHNNMTTLTSLRKLKIYTSMIFCSDIDKLWVQLSEVGSLKTLHLYYTNWLSFPPSLAGLSKLHHVTELKLSGKWRMLPPHYDFPPNLSRLSLRSTCLGHDPMPILEKLGQLSFLKMKYGAYSGRQLVISRHGFPQLKFLQINGLRYLKEINVESSALPQLQCLRIRRCISLRKLPEELKHMSTLDKLELVNMPKDFISRVDAEMVSRVPNLRIFDS